MVDNKRLKSSEDYKRVQATGKRRRGKFIRLSIAANEGDEARYGLVVSKQVGNAVTRNQIKRRLREIMHDLTLSPGWDVVVIASRDTTGANFIELKQEVTRLLGDSCSR